MSQIDMPVGYMYGAQCWNTVRDTRQKLTNITKLKDYFGDME